MVALLRDIDVRLNQSDDEDQPPIAGPFGDAYHDFQTPETLRHFTTWKARKVIRGSTLLRCNAAAVARRNVLGGWTWGTAINPTPRRAGSLVEAMVCADAELTRAGWRLLSKVPGPDLDGPF